jgi:hypothetical protein
MRRFFLALSLIAALAVRTAAEEIVLKDGTKIIGRMTAISGNSIEVETSYGKMSLKRGDILTISFPENDKQPAPTEAQPSQKVKPKIEETLDGTQYSNETGKFSLAVPADWKINPALNAASDALAGLSSRDNMRFLLVVREDFSGSPESYKGLTEIQANSNLQGYEKLSESTATIDRKSAILMSYRGTLPKANNLPVKFLTAIIADGNTYSRITTWCVEPLFNESQEMFEKIISSYHDTNSASSPSPIPKP